MNQPYKHPLPIMQSPAPTPEALRQSRLRLTRTLLTLAALIGGLLALASIG